MKIYMDCCCLNRPFDDQTDPIIHLEAEVIKIVIIFMWTKSFYIGIKWSLKFEIEKTPDVLRKEKLKILEQLAQEVIKNKWRNRNQSKIFWKFRNPILWYFTLSLCRTGSRYSYYCR